MGGGEVLFPVSGCILVDFFADHSFACNQFLMTVHIFFFFLGGRGRELREHKKMPKPHYFYLKFKDLELLNHKFWNDILQDL